MEIEKTPSVERLRQIPYSELKKIAKKHGIKGNLKAEKIIAALSSSESDDTESFSTPAQKLINSSKKNKKEKFDEDMKTPLETPRRGTYTIESPISMTVNDTPASVANGTVGFEISKVTPEKGSVKKLRSRKVSFLSPNMTPHTPKNTNLRLRPKTPIASFNGNISLSLSPVQQLQGNLEKSVNASLHKTPQPEVLNESSAKLLSVRDDASTKKKQVTTPRSTRSITFKSEISAKEKKVATPGSTKSLAIKGEISVKKKQIATPNFKKIHEKAFEKMESIVDYQKRKINSAKKLGRSDVKVTKAKSRIPAFGGIPAAKAKSRIPAFGGIPFIPSVPQSTHSKPNLNLNNKCTKAKQKLKHNEENTMRKNKSKFDLKASLSRKLGYKPYSGPLKPLTPSNKLNSSSISCLSNAKEPVNKVVNTNRLQNRTALKGVRTNKRFELQMKNRNLQ